jgi:hypothetical protein
MRLIDRWKYKDLIRGYPPLIFRHCGDPHSLTLAKQDANLAYLLSIAPDRIAAIRALMCQIGTPLPDIFDPRHAQRACNRLMVVFSAVIPKSVWKQFNDANLFHDFYYQPLAGPVTLCAACVDRCLLLGTQLIDEGTCTGWQIYQRDGKGRLVRRWSNFGVPILMHPNETIKENEHYIDPADNMGNWLLGLDNVFLHERGSDFTGLNSALSDTQTGRANYWGRVRLCDPSAGYDVLGRDMVQYYISGPGNPMPQGLPFSPPTHLRALTAEEIALHA